MSHSECMNAGDSTETGGRWTLKETTKNKTIYRGYIKYQKTDIPLNRHCVRYTWFDSSAWCYL